MTSRAILGKLRWALLASACFLPLAACAQLKALDAWLDPDDQDATEQAVGSAAAEAPAGDADGRGLVGALVPIAAVVPAAPSAEAAAPDGSAAQDVAGAPAAAPTEAVAQDGLATAERGRPLGLIADSALVQPQARYLVEAVSFRAVDESYPPSGSDRIYGVFYDADRDLLALTYTEADVDSGDIVSLSPNQSCIAPISSAADAANGGDGWSCMEEGAPAPIKFEVALFDEHDAPSAPSPASQYCQGVGDNYQFLEKGARCGGDEQLGRVTVSLSAQELAGWLRTPGSSLSREVMLIPPCLREGGVCANQPDYRLTFRIRRMDDSAPEAVLASQ
jgi:hypothetical protein